MVRKTRVAHVLTSTAVEPGGAGGDGPAEYFEVALQGEGVSDLQQNVEDVANDDGECELTVAAKRKELGRLDEFEVYEVAPEHNACGEKKDTTRWEIVHLADGL